MLGKVTILRKCEAKVKVWDTKIFLKLKEMTEKKQPEKSDRVYDKK